jgi:hypothetical protein
MRMRKVQNGIRKINLHGSMQAKKPNKIQNTIHNSDPIVTSFLLGVLDFSTFVEEKSCSLKKVVTGVGWQGV